MAITKTKFINYVRCPRYVALDKIRERLLDDVSLEEYKEEEKEELLSEIISGMEDESNGILNDDDPKLEALLPYYNEVEYWAAQKVKKHFKGKFTYSSKNTFAQKKFSFVRDGINYLCYVDIFNEVDDTFNIIEVKATTTKKVKDLGPSVKGEKHSIFTKDERGIYCLNEELDIVDPDITEDKYMQNRAHLFDRYHSLGHYVYDLAVQRYIIEHDLKSKGESIENKGYYLAFLNCDYVYDGTRVDGKRVYNPDAEGNDIVGLIDLTKITEEYQDKLELDFKRVCEYIEKDDIGPCPLGKYCEYKKSTMCRYQPLCFERIPHDNSIFAYIGLNKLNGLSKLDLVNDGIVNMLDVKEEELKSVNNIIERNCVMYDTIYVDKDKIKAGLDSLEYPIYHLDFETFPCPLPRFRNEKCYMQSPFQFSLHIEKEPGVCDKEKDHYGYLAKDNINDYRMEIGEALCEYIDIEHGGTVLAHNVTFERGRLKEISELFDDVKTKNKLKMMASKEHSFDTLYLVKNNKELYESLGITKNIDIINYYHPKLNGSYSIKKILPLFSDLSYSNLDVKNGNEALVTYSMFDKMTPEEYKFNYEALIKYCQQDTWAMVEILKGLRNLVK